MIKKDYLVIGKNIRTNTLDLIDLDSKDREPERFFWLLPIKGMASLIKTGQIIPLTPPAKKRVKVKLQVDKLDFTKKAA